MCIEVLAWARISCVHISIDSSSLDTKNTSGFGFFSMDKQFMSDKQGKTRSDLLTDGLGFHLRGSQT